jgi:lysophospholipase L1-like esterase
LFYGDSITVGADSAVPTSQGYAVLQRYLYGKRVAIDGYGYNALNDDTNTPALETAAIARLATYNPSIIWLAVGTNDYGLNKWNAVAFGTAYASFLDQLHAAIPSAKIVAQTPIVRVKETANTFGNTTGDYRAQITAACSTRPWVTLVNGLSILSTSDLDSTGVHPSTAGHAKYAEYVNGILNEVILNFGL